MRRLSAICAVVYAMSGIVSAHPGCAGFSIANGDDALRHIRFKNDRIAEVMRFAIQRSPAFRRLVTTIEASNSVVYIEEGVCHQADLAACIRLLPAGDSRYLQIRIKPREGLIVVAQHLAHELQHAVEILDRADIADDAGIDNLYRDIGYPTCTRDHNCWETSGARAMEDAVRHELVSSAVQIDRAYFGVWVLNTEKSQFLGAPVTIDGRRFHRDQRRGLISVVSEIHDGQGADSRSTFVFRPDGREYTITDDNGTKDGITLTAIDPLTIEFVLRHDGEVTANGVQRLSSDGRTLTIATCATRGASRPGPLSWTVWDKEDSEK